MNIKELVKLARKEANIFVKEEEVENKEEEVVEEVKANEVMNTWASNFWAELIPTNVMADPMLDLVGNYSRLLPLLPGNHWNNMAISEKVPVIWEAAMFQGNSEWTTWAWSLTPANNGPATDAIVISQWQYITTVDVSDRELTYATDRLESIIRERINRSAARTIDAVIINGDTTASWSGNVNGTYSGSPYFTQNANWLRKLWIANTVVSVWTLTSASYLTVKQVLGAWYQADLSNLLIIEPSNVYDKTLQLSEVITMDKFGPNATISQWVLAKIWNIDILVARDFPALTNTSWLVDATAANNTKWSFVMVYKPAVQYWFGKPLTIEVARVPGKWVKLVATFEFWFAVANNAASLGYTVAMWANVTV